jgi:hypothetical protein
MLAVSGGDAGGFLTAVLQGVERKIGFTRGMGMAVDGDDAAFFVQLVSFAKSGQWTLFSDQ